MPVKKMDEVNIKTGLLVPYNRNIHNPEPNQSLNLFFSLSGLP